MGTRFVPGWPTASNRVRGSGGGHLTPGRRAPRDAFGARVEIEARIEGREHTLVRVHQPHTSYLSGNDPRVHFGLGSLAMVPTLTVRWPSGRVQTWTDLPADRYWTPREGVETAE